MKEAKKVGMIENTSEWEKRWKNDRGEEEQRMKDRFLLVDVIMMGLINMKILFRVTQASNSRREQDNITMGQLQQ